MFKKIIFCSKSQSNQLIYAKPSPSRYNIRPPKRIDNCWLIIDIDLTIPGKDRILFLASIKTRPFEQYKTFGSHIDF
jgi:hypothetical protein